MARPISEEGCTGPVKWGAKTSIDKPEQTRYTALTAGTFAICERLVDAVALRSCRSTIARPVRADEMETYDTEPDAGVRYFDATYRAVDTTRSL